MVIRFYWDAANTRAFSPCWSINYTCPKISAFSSLPPPLQVWTNTLYFCTAGRHCTVTAIAAPENERHRGKKLIPFTGLTSVGKRESAWLWAWRMKEKPPEGGWIDFSYLEWLPLFLPVWYHLPSSELSGLLAFASISSGTWRWVWLKRHVQVSYNGNYNSHDAQWPLRHHVCTEILFGRQIRIWPFQGRREYF